MRPSKIAVTNNSMGPFLWEAKSDSRRKRLYPGPERIGKLVFEALGARVVVPLPERSVRMPLPF